MTCIDDIVTEASGNLLDIPDLTLLGFSDEFPWHKFGSFHNSSSVLFLATLGVHPTRPYWKMVCQGDIDRVADLVVLEFFFLKNTTLVHGGCSKR